jgi:cyclase
MLRPRIIASLLIQDNGLVKTTKFKEPRYLGDPMNAVRIFNEKEVDELAVFDISATVNGKGPNFKMIENFAEQCTMPLCYAGGITKVEEAQRIFSLGVEKIAISSAAFKNPKLITELSNKVGSQSVVVVLDLKKKLFGGYDVFTHNGTKIIGESPFDLIQNFEELGAGEIVINNIDKDGMMNGYDFSLIEKTRKCTTLPITVLGGAGSMEDIGSLIEKFGIIGAAAGSNFVYKGKLKGVLINYPNFEEKRAFIRTYFNL